MTPAGFPHSDIPGSTFGCQLPRAYRRLLRPSSALDAKASTMCPSSLVAYQPNTPNTTHTPTTPQKGPGTHAAATKMLASTIQISTNNPTPPTPTHNAQTQHGRDEKTDTHPHQGDRPPDSS